MMGEGCADVRICKCADGSKLIGRNYMSLKTLSTKKETHYSYKFIYIFILILITQSLPDKTHHEYSKKTLAFLFNSGFWHDQRCCTKPA